MTDPTRTAVRLTPFRGAGSPQPSSPMPAGMGRVRSRRPASADRRPRINVPVASII
jgi:hypothetical protein